MRKVYYINMGNDVRDEIISSMKQEIKRVAEYHGKEITPKTLSVIYNKSVDQLNRHVSQRANLKALWIFDSAESVPTLIDVKLPDNEVPETSAPKTGGNYIQGTDMKWTFKETEGLNAKTFKEKVIADIREDALISAFYGALSHLTEE